MNPKQDLNEQYCSQETLDTSNPPKGGSGVPKRSPFTVDEVARLYEVGVISKREAKRLLGIEEPQKHHNSHNHFMDQIVEK